MRQYKSTNLDTLNKNQIEGKAKVVVACLGAELKAAQLIIPKVISWKGWIEYWILGGSDAMKKKNYHGSRVHTIPNHHPPKRDVLPITFLQIILAAKWLLHPPTSSYNRCPSYSLIDTLYFNSCTTFLNKKIGFLTSNRCCTSFVVIWTTGDHYAIFFTENKIPKA